MGILDKVKNFFYEEEDGEEFEETMPIKTHHKEKKPKKEKKIRVVEDVQDEELAVDKQDLSERELFKAERTFNFPMDIYDDDINGMKEEIEEPTIVSRQQVNKPVYTQTQKQESPYSNIRSYAKTEEKKEEKETKKFRPTPVISPIYGILDKNYKKEDVIIDSASDFNEVKKVDYDTVRRKAYKDVYKEKEEENKGIFFNLDKENKEETEDEVKIVYNDVTLDEDEDDENVTIGEKIEKYQKELEKDINVDDYGDEKDNSDIDDDKDILTETKEQDLFNLIDNMYNSDDEDEEEE